MAFLDPGTAGVASSNLYTIFFTQFLGLVQCGSQAGGYGCYTGNITHDLIFNFLLPHVLIIGFILTFAGGGIVKNKGFQILLGVASYVVIIALGWYPFLASTMVWWFIVLLAFAIFNFISGGIFHPTRFEEMYKRGYLKGLSKQDKKKIASLKKQLQQINDRINQEENRREGPRERVAEKLIEQRHSLEMEIVKLERR